MNVKFLSLVIAVAVAMMLSFTVVANDELKAVNDVVEQQAQKLDQVHGLLMTAAERDSYKVKVIASKLADKQAINPELTINDLVNDGIATYEITDTYEQRQLLIELELMANGGGIEPPK